MKEKCHMNEHDCSEILSIVEEAIKLVEGINLIEADMLFLYKGIQEWSPKVQRMIALGAWSDEKRGELDIELNRGRQYLGKMLLNIAEMKKADAAYIVLMGKVNKYFGKEILRPRTVVDWDGMIEKYKEVLNRGNEGEGWKKG
jgi:hypothetical protein